MIKKIILASCLLVFSLFALSGPGYALEAGEKAPDFTLPTLDGNEVSLSDYKGKVILLKLATTWCPTCKQQTETILANNEFLKENDVVVVEVFVQDSEKMVRDYLSGKNFEMTHVSLLDDGQAYRAYNVYLIPRVLMISPDFTVFRDGGQLFKDDLRELVNQMTPAR